ncbi:hypothetical protein VULLAG_LOCUS7990 [Vulpes lagopus]
MLRGLSGCWEGSWSLVPGGRAGAGEGRPAGHVTSWGLGTAWSPSALGASAPPTSRGQRIQQALWGQGPSRALLPCILSQGLPPHFAEGLGAERGGGAQGHSGEAPSHLLGSGDWARRLPAGTAPSALGL